MIKLFKYNKRHYFQEGITGDNTPMPLRIIISGGGTGGHIFPAISIADAIKDIYNSADILFVGAQGRMEMEKVPAAGYKIVGLPIAGFQRKLIYKNFGVLIKLFKSIAKAKKIVKEFKPDIAIGVGGYASGPMLWVASNAGIPIFIQEQNSYAGITNKLLAKRAQKFFVAYNEMEKYFPKNKLVLSGNPIRKGLENVRLLKDEALNYFGLENNKPTILSIGGSLGAKTINKSIYESLQLIGESNVQFIWQCGKMYFAEAEKQVAVLGFKNIKLYSFISRMDLAYSIADVVISRAGASSISELCVVSKPAILVPSPNVAEDHQTKNAKALEQCNAAILIPDDNATKNLIPEAIKLVEDKTKCKLLSENIAKLALHNSADNIARQILESVKKN
jgi:UDP-N-acetylglucosamine--N-acetylmuramyl-(pentapeptide) pyrophosphoryl-undecaprenol N-acetylglucosamine transferase